MPSRPGGLPVGADGIDGRFAVRRLRQAGPPLQEARGRDRKGGPRSRWGPRRGHRGPDVGTDVRAQRRRGLPDRQLDQAGGAGRALPPGGAGRRQGRENTSTPREMAAFPEALYRGRVLGKAMTDDLFKVLSVPKDSSIPRELPADVRVADKPGSLEAVRTDSGIVFAKDRPFVISVMTTFDGDEKAAERTIGRIAAAAYRYFDRLGRSSPYGRAV